MFRKILIANRGEAALRVLRACRELDIKTVAVFSEVDRDAIHVQLADEAFCVGPAPVEESYLNIPNIIGAALISKADAIHPGYGFLAENHEFVEICRDHNIIFIGPVVESLEFTADKIRMRRTITEQDIPILPGTGVLNDEKEALAFAREHGYPISVKPAKRGESTFSARIVKNEEELRRAVSASSDSFGGDKIFLEKYIPEARRIEIQVLADKLGNVVYLGERDCSIQMRNQKVIEESPSQWISPYMRRRMGEAAVKCVKSIGYHGVGTVEFLYDNTGSRFYFHDMNTRLQAKHSVTEMVTGFDLVREQIRMEMDEPLEINQRQVFMRGHAIECRINAEDPENNFAPTTGEITTFRLPGGPGIRVDTHIHKGYHIYPFYDPLLAKVIAYGKDRQEALIRVKRAMFELKIEGVKTTIPFHLEILKDPQFNKCEIDSGNSEEEGLETENERVLAGQINVSK